MKSNFLLLYYILWRFLFPRTQRIIIHIIIHQGKHEITRIRSSTLLNTYQNFPIASSVEVPNHEFGSSNDSTDISTPLTNDLGVYNQISSNQNTGYGPYLSTVRPTNIHPQVYRAKAKV